jgi:hypothetical protein
MADSMAAILQRLRLALVEEATPLPGQQLAYGRPHGHPRSRYLPRYSPTGERLAGIVMIRPDCPRPVRGRCECPPDGSWRPAVGVIRADATATHARSVPASQLRPALEGSLWVADVYQQMADGLWHCRWPTRAALERIRGTSPRRWVIAVRLLGGQHPSAVWGAQGVPPDPFGEAIRILRQLEAWADEERIGTWERRPRQWWDQRRSNGGSVRKSQAQLDAEHGANGSGAVDMAASVATITAETEAPAATALPRSVFRFGRGQIEQPSGMATRSASGIRIPRVRVSLCLA